MRIALFWVDFLHYHVARAAAACTLATQNGHEIFPIAIRPGSPDFPVSGYQRILGNRIHVLADSPLTGGMQLPISARQLVSAIQEINPDAVAVAGYDTRVALAALGWCRRHKRGAILMTESQRRDFARTTWKEWIKRALLSQFDAALVGGTPQAEYVYNLGLPSERIFKGYDVVDNDFWAAWAARVRHDPQNWRQQLDLPDCFFLTACRLVPKKNVNGLLRAYAHYAAQELCPWPLVIVGDGPLRSELVNLAECLGVAQYVRFLGYLSAEKMGPVYGLATVFILASAYSEQWGLVVNEAMTAGLPVLVSQICGCVPDLVLNGITGYAFDPVDLVGLASLMAQCSCGELDLNQLGQAAQRHIQSYSPKVFAENLIASAEAAVMHANKRLIHGWPLPLILP